MINEQYKKSLNRYEGRTGIALFVILLCTPLFFIIMGCLNLWLASQIGASQGVFLSDYAQIWFEEIDIQREYTFSGLFLVGVHRFNTALLQLAVGLMFIPLVWSTVFLRKRDRAVINVLRKYGEL